jgi:hypothetical protein
MSAALRLVDVTFERQERAKHLHAGHHGSQKPPVNTAQLSLTFVQSERARVLGACPKASLLAEALHVSDSHAARLLAKVRAGDNATIERIARRLGLEE